MQKSANQSELSSINAKPYSYNGEGRLSRSRHVSGGFDKLSETLGRQFVLCSWG